MVLWYDEQYVEQSAQKNTLLKDIEEPNDGEYEEQQMLNFCGVTRVTNSNHKYCPSEAE